jgi:hypothetical protein
VHTRGGVIEASVGSRPEYGRGRSTSAAVTGVADSTRV